MDKPDLGKLARTIIDSNMYMVLGTADDTGQPWVSPVYYASAHYREFYWVSSPDVRHSRNIKLRPQISIVIFNSQARIGTGQGVYMSATAESLTGAELDRGITIFSETSLKHGGREWTQADVEPSSLYRFYRAIVLEHWVLDPVGRPDHRIPVTLLSVE
jgi:nitroimidazol reductase NimA-like FMN-containing flavoprotein (pyridoxamine 5'-phosphate oxidase superfamily)